MIVIHCARSRRWCAAVVAHLAARVYTSSAAPRLTCGGVARLSASSGPQIAGGATLPAVTLAFARGDADALETVAVVLRLSFDTEAAAGFSSQPACSPHDAQARPGWTR